MELKIIQKEFAICKVENLSEIKFDDDFYFIGKTDEEISLVCGIDSVPANIIEWDKPWKAFRIEGILDFSLIGILSKISTLLAENNIGIYAVSTFNTDYVLTKAVNFDKAIHVLQEAGYEVK